MDEQVQNIHDIQRTDLVDLTASRIWTDGREHAINVVDDGVVAYAYYMLPGHCPNFVWLYNRIPAPGPPDWEDERLRYLPVRNPWPYASTDPFPPIEREGDAGIVWREVEGKPAAEIRIHGRVHALLGIDPGVRHCVLSLRPNRVALPWDGKSLGPFTAAN